MSTSFILDFSIYNMLLYVYLRSYLEKNIMIWWCVTTFDDDDDDDDPHPDSSGCSAFILGECARPEAGIILALGEALRDEFCTDAGHALSLFLLRNFDSFYLRFKWIYIYLYMYINT